MNRNRYRLVFNTTLGMMVPVAETARRQGKPASGGALALAGMLFAGAVSAELPVPSAGGNIPNFVTAGQASHQKINGTQMLIKQVGDKSILNWQSFNISPGHDVQFRQVDSLATNNLVQGANFTSLNRIWDINPSIIAGSISQAAGQKANIILVNSNGIAFMGGSQVNLNQFTASTLNMDDIFVLDSLRLGDSTPQFEKALDGSDARGFIKVFENAKISADRFGRVMLIAPTVVNKGKVEVPDGQVIAAATSKVYLSAAGNTDRNVRGLLVEVDGAAGLGAFDTENTSVKDGQLDGQTVALTNAAEDKLGHVTNTGELSAPRGNVTMVGYSVNQKGIARATTSVLANGSVYLMAKTGATGLAPANRGGRVVLGAGSLTEVLPELADPTTSIDPRDKDGKPLLDLNGDPLLLEKRSQVSVLGQVIEMQGGASIVAPSGEVKFVAMDDPSLGTGSESPFGKVDSTAISNTARLHIMDGARIDVAGLRDVEVSAARNTVEIELRGDELKDSPVNQQGSIRGEKVYVDLKRALANADSGQSTLIARDALESNLAKLERTVAERSTTGGSVVFKSIGEARLDAGVRIDLSGGSVNYTAANVKTTLLSSGGKSVDISDANAETRYDGIATKFVIDYGRWNRQEVIDLGQSYRYDPGYVEGKAAGQISVIGMKSTTLQADVIGDTVTGALQRAAGVQPAGAKLTLGANIENDYKLNQKVIFGAALPAEIGALVLNPGLFGAGKVANLEVYSNQAAEVREALRLPQGGAVTVVAKGIAVNADVRASAGKIEFSAKGNSIDQTLVPLDVKVGDRVTLDASGRWVNDFGASSVSANAPRIDGGNITLKAEGTVELGTGSTLSVDSGGQLQSSGNLVAGNGGNVTLDGQTIKLGGEVRGYALGKGGSYTLKTQFVKIGGAADSAALNLDEAFFQRGGFARYDIAGAQTLEIADGTLLKPRVRNYELPQGASLLASRDHLAGVATVVERDARVRQAANVNFSAKSSDPASGTIRLGENTRIDADDGASISFSARNAVTLLGEVHSAGGSITASVSRGETDAFNPAAAVWLGDRAVLDVAGAARTYTDSRGLTQGKLLNGGTVTLDAQRGYVASAAGSRIDVSGAAPVRLDERNEQGGLGRTLGSDAGTIRVSATEGVLLDGALEARAGGSTNRGGTVAVEVLQRSGQADNTYPASERSLTINPVAAAQTAGLAPGDAIPLAKNGNSEIGANLLEASGADRLLLSAETIKLGNDLNLGGARTQPMREIALNSGRIETAGGDASVTARAVRLGGQASTAEATPGTGVLTVNASLLDVSRDLTLTGMARTVFNADEAIHFSSNGTLKTQADLVLHGALVAPATAVNYRIELPQHRLDITRNPSWTAPTQPFSAFGTLAFQAKDISQGGTVWAPLGQLAFEAGNTLEFTPGSLTSVAAEAGSLLPYGRVENGRTWVYGAGSSSVEIKDLPQKSITTTAQSIDMQAGAVLNLAGGGDVQAYEFTVGPGGSRDILADANTYAILPGFKGGFAPADLQEGIDRAVGEAVYLSGVPGLADGTYTLLPAHYALLPDAYAVKLDTIKGEVLPGQAYSRQDGVRIAAGYLTDSRNGAPRDARWQGVQVLTRDQVRARSELTLTRASDFFADSRNRPQDAGLLSVKALGSGSNALKLDATYGFAAATGGRGGQVDVSAQKIAVVSGTPTGLDPDAVVLEADDLNALGADSLLIGGTRASNQDGTRISVDAESVTLANDADHTLKASEVMLAATDTLTLRSGSRIDAQGAAGDAGHYTADGNGSFVRAGSTTASFSRSGNPNRSVGTLVGEVGSTITAADSITLDATKDNTYQGNAVYSKNGQTVAGRLAVGATRINFGSAPTGSEGLTYTQAELNALDVSGLTLISYSTFDFYGDVQVGGLDTQGKPVVSSLTLQGAGLAGIDNAGKTAQLNAQNLTLSNPNNAASFSAGGTLGSGNLNVTADILTLGAGDKAIKGFSGTTVTANELVGQGKGSLTVDAPLTLNVARIRGETGSNQAIDARGALAVAAQTADRALAPVTALGAKWALQGTRVDFDSKVELPSGGFKLAATTGDLNLGSNARVDVGGRAVKFFDVEKPSWGGTAEFVSDSGNVSFNAGAQVDVSAAAGGDAGTLIVRATQGSFSAASNSVRGTAAADAGGRRGAGARADIDVGTLGSFSILNSALNSGGFDGERTLRVRGGNVSIAAADAVKAQAIKVVADGGQLDVAGTFDTSGKEAGRIELYAQGDVNVLSTAKLKAVSSGADEDGGDIEIGTRDGSLNLAVGSTIEVSGGTGGQDGTLTLRAPRINGDTDVAVTALDSTVTGARSVAVEAVKVYDNKTTLNDSTTNSGTTLGLGAVAADNTAFAAHHTAIKARLNRPDLHVLSGVEVRSTGNLTLAQEWNLATARAGGEAGVLTLRAEGNLLLNSNLSDGFDVATPLSGTAPATLLSGDSWSYRLVAGADAAGADPLAVKQGTDGINDVSLAAGKLVRTGTGDIRIASGNDIKFGDDKSAVYTAGRLADAVAGFTNPTNAQFSQGGGDVSLAALGDISSPQRSRQLYSNWLFRQGQLNSTDDGYTTRPAWWVRFDQFQQGIGALGGGNVALLAGGNIENVSASAPAQARMASDVPDASALLKTGGGNVQLTAGADILGGQYYADTGFIDLYAGNALNEGQKVGSRSLYTILALGDSQARVRSYGDLNLHAILNPHLVVQTSGAGNNVNIANASSPLNSLFSTYSARSSVELGSLNGKVDFHNAPGGSSTLAVLNSSTTGSAYVSPLLTTVGSYSGNTAARAFALLPATLKIASYQDDVRIGGTRGNLTPSPQGTLEVLAAGNIRIEADLKLLDMAPQPDAVKPVKLSDGQFFAPTPITDNAPVPVHLNDDQPVRLYAVSGNLEGSINRVSLASAKAVEIRAGLDVKDFGLDIQHAGALNTSRIQAGRDVKFSELTPSGRSKGAYIWVGGPGRLEVTAGRNLDLAASAGIVSRGNLDNPALPETGADIHLAAGVGVQGIDYTGAVDRLFARLGGATVSDTDLWLARWLTGNASLPAVDAQAAVATIDAASPETQRAQVRSLLFTALRTSGRDSNIADSGYAGDFTRGYAALELLFPGIRERNTDGSFSNYQGDINLSASRVLTERGGNIESIVPGGNVIVGLANTLASLLETDVPGAGNGQRDAGVLGIVAVGEGDIFSASRGNVLVNQSRILTVGGGDILLWSSEGDIDAGKGKKSASVVPPPLTLIDKEGNVTQVLQGAASGSGIGALQPVGGRAGDVDLIAPEGTINAGDAGIRAGDFYGAAKFFLNQDNFDVSGTSSGTPVADTSAVTAASSGASNADGGVGSATSGLSQGLSEAARAADALKKFFKPTFISVEVVGHGE